MHTLIHGFINSFVNLNNPFTGFFFHSNFVEYGAIPSDRRKILFQKLFGVQKNFFLCSRLGTMNGKGHYTTETHLIRA